VLLPCLCDRRQALSRLRIARTGHIVVVVCFDMWHVVSAQQHCKGWLLLQAVCLADMLPALW
jgi:hypothetical protein